MAAGFWLSEGPGTSPRLEAEGTASTKLSSSVVIPWPGRHRVPTRPCVKDRWTEFVVPKLLFRCANHDSSQEIYRNFGSDGCKVTGWVGSPASSSIFFRPSLLGSRSAKTVKNAGRAMTFSIFSEKATNMCKDIRPSEMWKVTKDLRNIFKSKQFIVYIYIYIYTW